MGLAITRESGTMSDATAAKIKSTVESNCVVIYSKQSCPFCVMAIKVLKEAGVEYLEIDINKERNTSEIQDVLLQMTGARSVPRVFIGGKCIGGGTETKALHASGKLQTMIQQCQG